MSNLQLVGLTKKYPEICAVNNVNLTINEGEFFVIFGPSGAGKTTTLRLISGLEDPSSGEIYIGGRSAKKIVPEKRNIAFTFENYALYPHMSVYENIAYPLNAPVRNYDRDSAKQRIAKITKMLRIEELLERRPHQLSGGQKQRVALARSMVREADVYLLDEPLSHVDAKIRHEMRREFHTLKTSLLSTTIYVTHDYMEAISLGDRIAVINEGRVLQCDTPRELWFNPLTKDIAALVNAPKINLLEGEIVRNASEIGSGKELSVILNNGLSIPIPVEVQPQVGSLERILIGVRPISIKAAKSEEKMSVSFKATIRVIELLGTDVLLTVESKELKLRMVQAHDYQKSINTGEEIMIGWNVSDMFWFDPDTGLNIKHREYKR